MKRRLGKRFIIGFTIFTIILIALTMGAIYYTIKEFNQFEQKPIIKEQTTKKEADDKKYAINSYNETYNTNSIELKEIKNGTINYVQISGLKNDKIQRKINKRIKEIVDNLNFTTIYTYINGNFSNVLSLEIYGYDDNGDNSQTECLNIDLTTGNEIKITDLFVSSANLNLRLANAYYEYLAWGYEEFEFDNYDEYYNMDYRDTSEYEDKVLLLLRKFAAKKDDLKFSFTPSKIHIYDLAGEEYYLTVNLYEEIEEVAIYKRYLTEESIFVDNKNSNSFIVFTEDDFFVSESFNGKIADNIFVENTMYNNLDGELKPEVSEFINNYSQNIYDNLKNEIKSNQGAICQLNYMVEPSSTGQASILIFQAKAISSKDYFDKNLFKDYVYKKNNEIGMDYYSNLFKEYDSTKDVTITNYEEEYIVNNDGSIVKYESDEYIEEGEYNG